MLGDFFDGVAARAPGDNCDAGEDEGGSQQRPWIPFFAENQGRKREGDEWLKIDVNSNGARLDSRQRPGVQVVSADRRDKNDVEHGQPDARTGLLQGCAHQRVAADGKRPDAAEDENPRNHSQSPVTLEHIFRDGEIRAVGYRVENYQKISEGRIARKISFGVEKINHTGGGQRDAESFTKCQAVVAERDADEQREDGNGRAEQRRIDYGRQRQTFDEEKLVDDDAEKGVKGKARVITFVYLLSAANGALQDEEGDGRSNNAEGDEAGARQSHQGDLAENRPRAEHELDGDEREMRRSAAALECRYPFHPRSAGLESKWSEDDLPLHSSREIV